MSLAGDDPSVSVVIPTYNEADNLPELLSRLADVLSQRNYEIVVVDDNSPDGTWRIAEEAAADNPRIRVVRRLDESGLSSAILRGIQETQGVAIAVIDGDLQHDEKVLPAMFSEVLAGADVCIGSRKAEGGGYGEWSMARRLVSWGATVIAKTATRIQVTDPMSGFFVVSRDYFESVGEALNPRGFKVLLELLARGEPKQIAEVGYVFRERVQGETKLNGGVVYEYLLSIIDLRLGRVISSQAVTYFLVTLFGMSLNLIGYVGARVLDIDRNVASVVGFEVALIATFMGNNSFTFRSTSYRGRRIFKGLAFFHIVSSFGLLVQFAVFQLLKNNPPFLSVATGGSLAANGIAILAAAVATYSLHERYTWRRIRPA